MTLPQTNVLIADEAAGGSIAGSTSTFFLFGFTEKGTTEELIPIRSMAEAARKLGSRESYSTMVYDSLETFLREGGSLAYVGRVVGPSPVKASSSIYDQSGSTSGDISLTATAKEYGAGGNKLNVEAVYSGGTVYFKVSDDDDGLLETSPVFSTKADAVAWDSDYIVLTSGVSSELPRSQSVSLSSGADDHSNAVDAQWADALELATKDYGPGQVAFPGRTTDAAHLQLLAHAEAFHRNPLIDFDDTAVAADLVTDAEALTGEDGDRFSAGFAPWAIIPGATAGTTRTVPYSAVQAGLIARAEALGNLPNVAAAGELGRCRYVIGLSQTAWSDADRELLNDAGVNVAIVRNGEVRTYGYRSLADPTTDPEWAQFSGSREVCAIAHEAGEVLERFLFSQLDGRGLKIAECGGVITNICQEHYAADALYGATAEEAYNVDVGPSVNTPETIAAGQLNAALRLKTSPFAESVSLTVTKINSSESL